MSRRGARTDVGKSAGREQARGEFFKTRPHHFACFADSTFAIASRRAGRASSASVSLA